MEKKSTLFFLISIILIGFCFPNNLYSQSNSEENTLNPGLNIPDGKVKRLDGAYSIVTVDNGQTQKLSIEFNQGQIKSVFMNGQEIPKEKWSEFESTIAEYVEYIETEENTNYKYKDWYDLESDLKKDLSKLRGQIKDLEVHKRLKMFYDEEMKDWVEELEKEINESEFIQDLEIMFDELMLELDEFLSDRKEYNREREGEKE